MQICAQAEELEWRHWMGTIIVLAKLWKTNSLYYTVYVVFAYMFKTKFFFSVFV